MDSKAARLIPVALVLAVAARSQTFEVASVKPSGPDSMRGSHGGPGTSDPTHYRFGSATLQDLIANAWHLAHYYQISSREALDKQRFDLSVVVPAGANRQKFRVMLQSLLAERFHLKAHLETRDFPGYELTIAKSGPKLKESVPGVSAPKPAGDEWPDLEPGKFGFSTRFSAGIARIRAQQAPIAQLTSSLRIDGDPPIVDKTGLSGTYDLTLEYATPLGNAPGAPPVDPMAVPELFEALKQQLGLQLAAKKVPLDVVVVESVDKLPSDN